MRTLFFLILFFANGFLFSQGRLILNNNPYIVMQNGANIVLENGNTNAITTQGSGGNIVSESENNKIKWKIGTNTGTYTVPFTDNVNSSSGNNAQGVDNGTKIPYTLNITSAATGGNYYEFSTYDGSSWDNQNYMPSMVTHMGQLLAPYAANHSEYAIDRFWVINLVGYSTKPIVIHTFYYIDNEITAPGNSLLEVNLGAQRFNDPAGTWGDMLPVKASQNMGSNFLITPPIASFDFFAAWVLSDIIDPLPIELTKFTAKCKMNGDVNLTWSTNSEINNDFFTLEKSYNGYEFFSIGIIDGAGNSSVINNYNFTDSDKDFSSYYRLKQTDFNGDITYSDVVSVKCEENEKNIYAYTDNGQIIINIESNKEEKVNIEIVDARGRKITNMNIMTVEGMNTFNISESISTGIYFIRINSQTINKSIKIYK
jgi:hypothetical protein